MAAVTKSLPVWKLSLLEKRRLQAALDENHENVSFDRFSQMPQWKREILLRKQNCSGHCKARIAPSSDKHRSGEDDVASSTAVCNNRPSTTIDDEPAVTEEHLAPVKLNPIWRQDVEKRRSLTSQNARSAGSEFAAKCNASKSSGVERNEAGRCAGRGIGPDYCDDTSLSETSLDCVTAPEETNSVEDDEDELVYGQGFVSKLLDRFRQLLMKDDNALQRRSVSSDSLLDDCHTTARSHRSSGEYNCHGNGGLLASRSMDNLAELAISRRGAGICDQPAGVLRGTATNEVDVNCDNDSSLLCGAEASTQDELPKPNTVVTVRTVFENFSKTREACDPKSRPTSVKFKTPDRSDAIAVSKSSNSVVAANARRSNEHGALADPAVNGVLFSNAAAVSRLPASDADNNILPGAGAAFDSTSRRNRLNLDLSEGSRVRKSYNVGGKDRSSANNEVSNQRYSIVSNSAGSRCRVEEDFSNGNCEITGRLSSNCADHDAEADEPWLNGYIIDESDGAPREGDPSEISVNGNVRYEFEGAGIIVDRSLLAKSKNSKQMVLSFNEAATRTHEYPSEQSLWDVSDTRHDGELGVDYDDDGSSYYDLSLSSYKLRSQTDSYQIGSESSRTSSDAMQSTDASDSVDSAAILLRPVDSESSTWSSSATADLLF